MALVGTGIISSSGLSHSLVSQALLLPPLGANKSCARDGKYKLIPFEFSLLFSNSGKNDAKRHRIADLLRNAAGKKSKGSPASNLQLVTLNHLLFNPSKQQVGKSLRLLFTIYHYVEAVSSLVSQRNLATSALARDF